MKNNFKIIRTIIFIFSIIFFLFFVFSSFYMLKNRNSNTWILSVAITLINFLLTNILSFINLIVLPPKNIGMNYSDKFSDRKDIIIKIVKEVNNNTKAIKIFGTPLSGKSELLKYLYKITTKKKELFKSGINKKIAKDYYFSIGRVHYLDGEIFSGKINVLFDNINNLSFSRKKKTIIFFDNIYKIDCPNNILELLCSKKHRDVYVIYTLNYDDPDTFKLNGFIHKDILELSKKYMLCLSSEEINNIYLATCGNIGLINLVLKHYKSQIYFNFNNLIEEKNISLNAQKIIKSILHDNEIIKLAILCATINICKNDFSLIELSKILGYNVSSLDLEKLLSTGLFYYNNNSYYSSDYISQIIRSINYEEVNKILHKLISFYTFPKNKKIISILLLCKHDISEEDVEIIHSILIENSLKNSLNNLPYLLKLGKAYNEFNFLDISLSKKYKELKEEIIYQYTNALIYIGDYKLAAQLLQNVNSPKLLYTKADLAHLRNNYNLAIGLFTIIINNYYPEYYMARIKLAHCYKHIGHFCESLDLLKNIEKENNIPITIKNRAKTDSLSIYILQNDVDGLRQELEEIFPLEKDLKDYQKATFKRYNSVKLAYDYQYENAIIEINKAIDLCNKTHSRLRYNCYYIRGEINRFFKYYNKAIKDIVQCYRASFWNDDYNLRSMATLSLELLKNNVDYDFPVYDLSAMIERCTEKNMLYNTHLLKKIFLLKTFNHSYKDFEEKIYIVP